MRLAAGIVLITLYLPLLVTITSTGWRTTAIVVSTAAGIAGVALIASAIVRRRKMLGRSDAASTQAEAPAERPSEPQVRAAAVGDSGTDRTDRPRLRLVYSDGRPLSYKPKRRSFPN